MKLSILILELVPVGETPDGGGPFFEKVRAYSERLIRDALKSAGGNQTEAARRLGLSYHQFRYHCKKYLGNSAG